MTNDNAGKIVSGKLVCLINERNLPDVQKHPGICHQG